MRNGQNCIFIAEFNTNKLYSSTSLNMRILIGSQGLGTYFSLVLFCGNLWNQPVHKKKTIKGKVV